MTKKRKLELERENMQIYDDCLKKKKEPIFMRHKIPQQLVKETNFDYLVKLLVETNNNLNSYSMVKKKKVDYLATIHADLGIGVSIAV